MNALGVAAGSKHSVILDSTYAVFASGLNSSGQLGNKTTTTPSDYFPVAVVKSTTLNDFLTNCKQVAAAGNYSAALSTDGKVYTWGEDVSGRLGRVVSGTDNLYAKPVKSALTGYPVLDGIYEISAGTNHMLARSVHTSEVTGGNGHVWVWGLNSSGQLGLGNTTTSVRATESGTLSQIVDISAGEEHSAVVKLNASNPGRVFCFGQQEYGRLGNGTTAQAVISTPVGVIKSTGELLENVVSVAAGPRHTLALGSDRKVWAWGSNASGELGDSSMITRGKAKLVPGLSNIVRIAAGGEGANGFSLAVAENGTIYGWGSNSDGQLAYATASTYLDSPTAIGTLKLTDQGLPVLILTATYAQNYEVDTITLHANASDPDGFEDIAQVSFFNGSTLLGVDTSPPYDAIWPNVAAGSYNLTAVVTEVGGAQSTSNLQWYVRAVVKAEALTSSISEKGLNTAVIRLTRKTANASPLQVSFTFAGTASNGRDFQPVPTSATIQPNETYVDVPVVANTDYLVEGPETIILKLSDNAAHFPDPLAATATINLADVEAEYDPGVNSLDSDGDGLTDEDEIAFSLDPNNADSDGDGIPDGIDPDPKVAATIPLTATSTILVWAPAE